ncbi:unnamed protein product [Mytilus coruscus]|uniref:LRRCT domain-containing protein n=1 Tax=Mytilus coruscus TaxID=42192 RepID=A0A6J7ZYQ9_MYTCO|nr:unnamed protein product [Mytilus coruscus]
MCRSLFLQEFIIICFFVVVASVPQQTCDIRGVCECDLDTYTSLDKVNCSMKDLDNIPKDLPTNRQYYTFASNLIYSLEEDAFEHIVNAYVFGLQYNELVDLPEDVFDPVKGLLQLDLKLNKLVSLPIGIFKSLGNLITLLLQGNMLISLEAGIFDNLYSLEQLYLQDNVMITLEAGIFDLLYSLEILLVNNNMLTTLDVGVFDGTSFLQTLFLHQNKLSNIPVGIFDSLYNLLYLNIRNNALQCDCSQLDLYLLIKAMTKENILVNADCTVIGQTDRILLSNLTEAFFQSCTDTTVHIAEPTSGLTEIVSVSLQTEESSIQLTQTILESKTIPKEQPTHEPTSIAIHTEQESSSNVIRMKPSTNTDQRVYPFEETTVRDVQQQKEVNNVKTSAGIPLTPMTAGTVVGVTAVGVIAYFSAAKLASKLRLSSAVKPKDQQDINMTRPRLNKTDDYGLTFRPSEDDEKRRRRQFEEMIDLNHV